MVWIRHTAVDWTNGRTLGFFVEASALGAFARDNKVKLVRNRRLVLFGVNGGAIRQPGNGQLCAAGPRPLPPPLINGCIRAFRFAGPAIDTLVCNFDRHLLVSANFGQKYALSYGYKTTMAAKSFR